MAILEEETYIEFGYYPRDLKPQSNKKILAACDDCCFIRETSKNAYCDLCQLCSRKRRKGKNNSNWKGGKLKRKCVVCGKEIEVKPSEVKRGKGKYCSYECMGIAYSKTQKGKDNPHWQGGKVKRICPICSKPFEVLKCKIAKGNGKYCSKKCMGIAQSKNNRGENNPRYNGGRKAAIARRYAKRKRELGFTILMPLNDGEIFHHVTNEYVIGIKKEVHRKFSGYNRKKHRTHMLQWLKVNDKKKYNLVLCVLAKEPLR